MIGSADLLGLASSVLLGSAIPFVPTGELVSGSAALVANSWSSVVLIFVVSWVCSLIGDTLLLIGVRLLRGHLEVWLERHKFGGRVRRAQAALTDNAFGAVITGRLIPGGRAPVIIALGLSRFSVRQFAKIDLVACAAWAAVYSVIGALGGSLVSNPVWAMVIAVAAAVSLSVVLQRLRPVVATWHRQPGTHPNELVTGLRGLVTFSTTPRRAPPGVLLGRDRTPLSLTCSPQGPEVASLPREAHSRRPCDART